MGGYNFNMPKIFKKETPMYTPKPTWIIIHSTSCIFNDPDIKIDYDNKKFQYPHIKFQHIKKIKLDDINFHYTIELITGDYEIFVGKPMHLFCQFPDILPLYEYSIHIAILGNLNDDIAEKRVYDTLAYRLICPLLYWFNINKNNVITHKKASGKSDHPCPGEYFFMENLKSSISRFIV